MYLNFKVLHLMEYSSFKRARVNSNTPLNTCIAADNEPKAIDTDSIMQASYSFTGASNSCMEGLSKSGGRTIIVLNPDELVEKIEI